MPVFDYIIVPVSLSTRHIFLPTRATSLSDPSIGMTAPTMSGILNDLQQRVNDHNNEKYGHEKQFLSGFAQHLEVKASAQRQMANMYQTSHALNHTRWDDRSSLVFFVLNVKKIECLILTIYPQQLIGLFLIKWAFADLSMSLIQHVHSWFITWGSYKNNVAYSCLRGYDPSFN